MNFKSDRHFQKRVSDFLNRKIGLSKKSFWKSFFCRKETKYVKIINYEYRLSNTKTYNLRMAVYKTFDTKTLKILKVFAVGEHLKLEFDPGAFEVEGKFVVLKQKLTF